MAVDAVKDKLMSRVGIGSIPDGINQGKVLKASVEKMSKSVMCRVCGESPWGGGYHAWLLVETSEGAYMPVEATEYDVVWWSNPYFDNYFEYDFLFETIHDALDHSYSEFNWWN